jgi:hypothetical protein
MDLVFHQEIIPHQSFFTTGDYAITLAEREKNDISGADPKTQKYFSESRIPNNQSIS